MPFTMVVSKNNSPYSDGQNATYTVKKEAIGVMLLALPSGIALELAGTIWQKYNK